MDTDDEKLSSTLLVPDLIAGQKEWKDFRIQELRWISALNIITWCCNIPTKYLYSFLVLNIQFY